MCISVHVCDGLSCYPGACAKLTVDIISGSHAVCFEEKGKMGIRKENLRPCRFFLSVSAYLNNLFVHRQVRHHTE